MAHFKQSKKILGWISLTLMINIFTLPLSSAASPSENYLYNIMQYTKGTLKAVNALPSYLNNIFGRLAISWLAPDDTKSTADMQANFATIGYLAAQNAAVQNGLQQQLMADLLNQPIANFTTPAQRPAILNILPNVNDLSYATMLSLPPVPKGPASPYNYIKAASGISNTHAIPGANWQGSARDQLKYTNYFSTVTAIESFTAYVLSDQYAENQNGNGLNTVQTSLINQASNSTWLAQVATEELGKVLRQILMFESQNYVILTQLLQTQKKLLTAQVMTNSLLISNNLPMENLLVSNAQGVPPTG